VSGNGVKESNRAHKSQSPQEPHFNDKECRENDGVKRVISIFWVFLRSFNLIWIFWVILHSFWEADSLAALTLNIESPISIWNYNL
jgi:hypothetical protein